MIINLDTKSDTPLYLQLRNEIIKGVYRGELSIGSQLPTIRQLADDIGVNPMTVNKSYALLKQEGYIEIDRRKGATIVVNTQKNQKFDEDIKADLELLVAESALKGISKEELIHSINTLFDTMQLKQLALE